MSTDTTCRRRDERYEMTFAGAYLLFTHPKPNGRGWQLALLDLSLSGVSFRLEDDLEGIEPGMSILDVTLRAGEAEACGELLIMHVTRAEEGGGTCGALFYPESDADMRTIHDLLAGMSLNQAG